MTATAPADISDRIFEPFNSGSGSAGLRLYLVRELALANGGSAYAGSSQKGARFVLELPLDADSRPGAQMAKKLETAPRVLVVDGKTRSADPDAALEPDQARLGGGRCWCRESALAALDRQTYSLCSTRCSSATAPASTCWQPSPNAGLDLPQVP